MEKLRTEFVNTKEKVKDVAAGLVAAAIIGITFPIRLVLAGGRKIVAFVKNNKVKTLIFALVAIIIVLAVLLVNALRNPKIEEKVVTEYVEVVKEVIVEVPVEAETEESDKTTSSSNSGYTGVILTDANRKDFIDMAEDHTDVSVSQKAEGSVETNQDEIVERDPEAKKSLENITAIVDDKKKEEEINSDPSKKEVAKDTIGTDDTGSNKNVVEKEDESKKAYTEEETTDCSTKEEEQPVAKTEETTEDFKDVEEADDDFLNEVEFDIPEIKVEDEQDEVIAPVVEDTTETTEETTDVVEYVVEETTFVEEETTVANIVVEEETKVVEAATEVAEEKVEDLVINDSFVSTSVDGVATIVANAGRIASANAGEGVNVSVEGNTVRVSLQNPENTVVDVDIVDVNGNIVTAVVAFN